MNDFASFVRRFLFVLIFSSYIYNVSGQTTATFENLTLPPDSFWNNADSSDSFQSGAGKFINIKTTWAWSGFAYSNKRDTVTAGWTNEFSTFAIGSPNFAVAYCSPSAVIHLLNNEHHNSIRGFYVSNNTYAAINMRDGDGTFSKKFGGPTGNDPDWFKLKIQGYDNGQITDSVNFFLADYRFPNNDSDYIVKNWRWVDLSSIGNADSLEFSLSSSDNGAWGMNTPAYFCMDNLLVDYLPENELTNDSIFITECNFHTFDLDTFFNDLDTDDSLLTYEIVSNTQSSIFNTNISGNILEINIVCLTKDTKTIVNGFIMIRAISPNGYNDYTFQFTSDLTSNLKLLEANRFSISPNPASASLSIHADKNTTISISDIYGKTIYSGIPPENKIDVSNYVSGIYFISYKNQVIKFVKN